MPKRKFRCISIRKTTMALLWYSTSWHLVTIFHMSRSD